jgi:hypothetical protein
LLPTTKVLTLKLAQVLAAATVTDEGTVSVGLVLVRVTVTPPVGDGWVKVTVQVLEELGPRLVGLQASVETSAGAIRVTVALAELLL